MQHSTRGRGMCLGLFETSRTNSRGGVGEPSPDDGERGFGCEDDDDYDHQPTTTTDHVRPVVGVGRGGYVVTRRPPTTDDHGPILIPFDSI